MKLDRRSFVKTLGAVGVATTVPAAAAAQQTQAAMAGMHMHHHGKSSAEPVAGKALAPSAGKWEAYTFLNADEAAFVEAAVNTLIPADDLSPSGVDVGVAYFIDQQLGGAFGRGAKLYRQGPWPAGMPEQGWQLPLTPAELYQAAIPLVNEACRTRYGKSFSDLGEAQRTEAMTALEKGTLALGEVPGQVFFELLLQNVIEGFFGDPAYGGNRDKIAWKMIGYPGVIGNYGDIMEEYHNKPYTEPPQSIADNM